MLSFASPFTPRALLLACRAHDLHIGWNLLAENWPISLWPERKLREFPKLSSREAEHTRAPGSAPERTARKQTARSLQALTWHPGRNIRLDRLAADCQRE